ncbi:TIGR04283 family arsenosugar biosynthesis glycosyltransferase [Desulfocurvibacter africanus]|uniref:Glycosyltransferase 2-like domain-containing protein n=1 Tax=Desulfocurvibacter africanus subsp. africanus str. Walvis Bay TaxID=690850 RepID=F3YTS3_DESAF|nr:TIGR04283 family arsenosugar biosynthesis glycosyltransferase [Desulfocurvibacter africanus]EGJ48454.1 Protein of unknown function DUF2064 [Desulfocurvibacter africanus subsp. africanus str. Walvis Bay]
MTAGSVILFTRFPVPGQTKTRLIPALGPEGAARLQEAMTGCAVLTARSHAAVHDAMIQVRFDGTCARRMRAWLGPELAYLPQGPGDLGLRMDRALGEVLRHGRGPAVLVGCDCPGLDGAVLRAAFEALQNNDVVLGPADDGGYYLVGLRAPASCLFRDMPWGTGQVLVRTLAAASQHGLRVALVEARPDVDRPEDLPVWERTIGLEACRGSGSISVVVPALNEETHIARCVARALEDAQEVIIVDGGSRDRTAELAEQAGARVVRFPHGRAAQMNKAALAARGEILLFLHADTLLPRGWASAVREIMVRDGLAAGAFSLGIEGQGRGFRLVEAMTNARSRLLGLPYGDQALFMRRERFLRLGGYANMPIMEDYELVRRLGRTGRVATLRASVSTSSRRWARLGVTRTTTVNQMMILGYWLGISADKLAAYYRRKRR